MHIESEASNITPCSLASIMMMALLYLKIASLHSEVAAGGELHGATKDLKWLVIARLL